jgi:multidrug resistance efflux pump
MIVRKSMRSLHKLLRRRCPRPGFVLVIATALVPLAAAGCQRTPAAAPAASEGAAGKEGPPSVRVVTPQRTTIHRSVSQPGAIQAYEETPIFAKIAGYVEKWNVDIGARVHKGQVLAVLSVPELEVELLQKEALIEQGTELVELARKSAAAAEAAFKSAEAQINEAEASKERAVAERKRLHSQYQRLARAGRNGVITRESSEESRLRYEAALAGVRQAEARIRSAQANRDEYHARWDKAEADVRVAKANLEVARKNRDYVKAQLQYTRLTAPYDGVVTQQHINTGDFVQLATAGKGRPLYVVQRRDKVRIFVQVPEADAEWVRQGAEAQIRVQALRGRQ